MTNDRQETSFTESLTKTGYPQ